MTPLLRSPKDGLGVEQKAIAGESAFIKNLRRNSSLSYTFQLIKFSFHNSAGRNFYLHTFLPSSLHYSTGNMKLAVKIRPYFVEKYQQSRCVGGTVNITKGEESRKACRKRCKRRRGCKLHTCIGITSGSCTFECRVSYEV